MSKDRARRRDEREQAAAVRRVAAARRRARVERRQDRRRALAPVAPRLRYRKRWRRQEGILARRRRAQNGVILCLILASQLVVWLLTPDWYLRVAAALLAVIATPVLVTIALDRRP